VLSAWFSHALDKPLAPVARHIPLSPNAISVSGFLITVVAAFVIYSNPLVGGILVLVGGFFDMLDGVIARNNGKRTRFGAFLDSTLDRYSDSSILIGMAAYCYRMQLPEGALLAVLGIVGSLLVSYTRARAEGLGLSCTVGVMERPERIVALAAGCITGLILPSLVIVCLLSHITAIQRILHVRKLLRNDQQS
jgi:phosphatidylglycerophosphate synthase